ncbi:LysR family transcriptional regulator [Pseudomonas sp. CGJS7]|uniref:LysR family transcriptional regulator n=1 Tax=Pseudomonas sp. CGJS7 TaxID=3109348 RepID=UPI00300BDBCC
MDRLDAMAIFVCVVDKGSLAAAARALGRSPATVTRAVSLLEQRSGERLLHRSARRMRLTDGGERHVAVYRSVLAELADIEDAVTHDNAAGLDGSFAITAPELFGRLKVLPVVEDFLAEHPLARARVLLLNRVVNLIEEGIDVAVRLAPLPDSGAVAIGLGEVRSLVCAAPAYLARHGEPHTPADIARHTCLGEDEAHERETWRFLDRGAARPRTLSVSVQPRIALNAAASAIDSAIRGHGLCRARSYQVIEHLAAGRLVRVLSAFEPEPVPVSLLFHRVPRRNRLLRAFIDYATPRLRGQLDAIAAATGRL